MKKKRGVLSIGVALLAEKAELTYNPKETNPDRLAEEVKELGFGVEILDEIAGYSDGKITISIGGMTCASCVHNIEKALHSSGGVQKAVVALATGKGYIEFDPEVLGPGTSSILSGILGSQQSWLPRTQRISEPVRTGPRRNG
eukprot:Em0034g3a